MKFTAPLFIFLILFNSCTEKKYADCSFINSYNDGTYSIQANIESTELMKKYYDFFVHYGYSGNGETWKGIIEQILEKKDPELLLHIQFDPEAGGFFANADSKNSQQRFNDLLCPVFSDTTKLGEFVRTTDRSKVDD